MRKIFAVLLFFVIVGCAKVSVETKNPIKVDITMRIDVYQHTVQEVESINDQIYGSSSSGDKKDKQLNWQTVIGEAYAASDLPVEVSDAISRIKLRKDVVDAFMANAYLGENKDADLEIIGTELSADLKDQLEKIVKEENADRAVLYEFTAVKTSAQVSEVRKINFADHYKRAPAGYWFQIYDEAKGAYIWKQK